MPFDFKKEYKEFYLPKDKPEIVTVPKANYIADARKVEPAKWKTIIRHPIAKKDLK